MKRGVLCLLGLVFVLLTLNGCKGRTVMKGEKIADGAIAADIRSRFTEAGLPPVRVFVLEGRVTLSGTVPNEEAKKRAIELARTAPGVTVVSDDLELQKIRWP